MTQEERDLMTKILNCYIMLSPENIFMDGEATLGQARTMTDKINKELRRLFKRLGRVVSESEAYNACGI